MRNFILTLTFFALALPLIQDRDARAAVTGAGQTRDELREIAKDLAGTLAELQAGTEPALAQRLSMRASRSLARGRYLLDTQSAKVPGQEINWSMVRRWAWVAVPPVVATGLYAFLKINYHDIPWFGPAGDLAQYANIWGWGRVSDIASVIATGHLIGAAASPSYRGVMDDLSFSGQRGNNTNADLASYFAQELTKAFREKGRPLVLDTWNEKNYASVDTEIQRIIGQNAMQGYEGKWKGMTLTEKQARKILNNLATELSSTLREIHDPSQIQTALIQNANEIYNEAESIIYEASIKSAFMRDTLAKMKIGKSQRARLREYFFTQVALGLKGSKIEEDLGVAGMKNHDALERQIYRACEKALMYR